MDHVTQEILESSCPRVEDSGTEVGLIQPGTYITPVGRVLLRVTLLLTLATVVGALAYLLSSKT